MKILRTILRIRSLSFIKFVSDEIINCNKFWNEKRFYSSIRSEYRDLSVIKDLIVPGLREYLRTPRTRQSRSLPLCHALSRFIILGRLFVVFPHILCIMYCWYYSWHRMFNVGDCEFIYIISLRNTTVSTESHWNYRYSFHFRFIFPTLVWSAGKENE